MKKQRHAKELIDKLLKNRLSREEFEQFLDGLDDAGMEKDYEQYLRSNYDRIMDEYVREQNADQQIFLKSSESQNTKNHIHKLSYRAMRWAAVIVMLVGVYFTFRYVIARMEKDSAKQMATNTTIPSIEKVTKEGNWAQMNLSDGSFIHLNADSKLTYPQQFATSHRSVSLEGEAYFDVQHEENRPFLIKVKDVTVEVLGTSFDIKAYDNDGTISVTVETGRVRVDIDKVNGKSVYLSKNQKLEYLPATNTYQVTDVEASRDLSWRNGILYFDQTPFAEVKHTIERWYGVNITVKDTAIINKKISGEHKNENLISVLEALKYALNVDYEINGKNITLK